MKNWLSLLASASMLFFLVGCSEDASKQTEQKAEVSRPVPMMLITNGSDASVLRFPGRVRSAQRAELAFNVPGQVIELPVEEGQHIEKGQLVARLDDTNYRVQMQSAQANYNKVRTDYQRVAKIWETKQMIAKTEVDRQRAATEVAKAEYELAQKRLDDTRLLAPFAGVVTRRLVENYSNVQDKAPIVSLQNLNDLEIVINVPERIVRSASKSYSAFAVFADHPDQLLPVQLKSFSAESDSQTQSYEAVLTLEPGYSLNVLPGMSVEIVSDDVAHGQALSNVKIPLQAVHSASKDSTHVWVINSESSRVQQREVVLGKVQGSDVVVLSGLAIGERIATAGVSQLRENMLVRPLVNKGATTQGADQ